MTAPDAPVLAAYPWPSNAHLIADVARLGYLRREWVTLDPTYGQGRWWRLFCPDDLLAHDIRLDGVDFRRLPYGDGVFQAAAFDPPYVAPGGRSTSTIGEFNDAFGLHTTAKTPAGQQQVIDTGLKELLRVVRGVVVVKCADYIWSGKLWPGSFHTLRAALDMGYQLEDRFEHVGRPRAQPAVRGKARLPSVQRHARRNLSTLLILRTP